MSACVTWQQLRTFLTLPERRQREVLLAGCAQLRQQCEERISQDGLEQRPLDEVQRSKIFSRVNAAIKRRVSSVSRRENVDTATAKELVDAQEVHDLDLLLLFFFVRRPVKRAAPPAPAGEDAADGQADEEDVGDDSARRKRARTQSGDSSKRSKRSRSARASRPREGVPGIVFDTEDEGEELKREGAEGMDRQQVLVGLARELKDLSQRHFKELQKLSERLEAAYAS